MKYIYTLSFVVLSSISSLGQNIDLELISPNPQLQDADLGDMEFADIDNDGDNDLIITGKGGPVLTSIYKNDGNGNFTNQNQTTIENVFESKVGFSDFDDDGDFDLLLSGSNSSPTASTNLYLNDGTGIFNIVANTPFAAVQSGNFAIGDVENDGDDDILLTGMNNAGNPISILYLNNGAGIFAEVASTVFEPLWDASLQFFDYDNDSDLDVIIAGADFNDNPTTVLYSNNGAGVFSLVSNAGFNNFLGGDVAIGDTDNDGDLDVLICGNKTNIDIETELYLNDGNGNFTLLNSANLSDVSVGEASFQDFDNDGDLDVFLIGTGEGGLATNSIVANIFENLGSNNFVIADSLIGGYFSSHAAADIDGDNDIDLVLGGTTISQPVRATWMYVNESIQTTNIEELNSSIDPIIYPNPSTGLFNLNLIKDVNAIVNIYSVIGRVVYSGVLEEQFNQIELKLPNGIYNVIIKSNEKIYTQKLILKK